MKIIITALLSFICFGANAHIKIEQYKIPQKESSQLKKHPHLSIKIDSIQIDDQLYAIDFSHEGKIKKETGLLHLNDSIALNVIYLKTKILVETTYFDNISIYRKNKEGKWTTTSLIMLFTFTPGSYTNGWGSRGTPGYPGYFRYKMYMQFT